MLKFCVLDAYTCKSLLPRELAEAPLPHAGWVRNTGFYGYLIGRSADGGRVVKNVVGWAPSVTVRMPRDWDEESENEFLERLERTYDGVRVVYKKLAKGFVPGSNLHEPARHKFVVLKLKQSWQEGILKMVTTEQKAKWLTQTLRMPSHMLDDVITGTNFDVSDKFGYSGINMDDLFLCDLGITTGTWISVPDNGRKTVQLSSIRVHDDLEEVPPIVVASFDLEVVSGKAGTPYPRPFPKAHRVSDKIVQCGFVKAVHIAGKTEVSEVHVWCLGEPGTTQPNDDLIVPTPPVTVKGDDVRTIPPPIITCFATEAELLNRFADEVRQVDVLTGFNISGFDLPYLFLRANAIRWFRHDARGGRGKPPKDIQEEFYSRLGGLADAKEYFGSQQPECHLHYLSPISGLSCEGRMSLYKSEQQGEIKTFRLRVPGVALCDMWTFFKTSVAHKLSSYKLDVISENILVNVSLKCHMIQFSNHMTRRHLIQLLFDVMLHSTVL